MAAPLQTPKFNLNRMAGCIVVSLNEAMADSLLSLLQEFSDSELHPFEFAFMKQLERLVLQPDKRPDLRVCSERAKE